MSDIIDTLKASAEKFRHKRKRTLAKGLRLDMATYTRLINLLSLIRDKAPNDDRIKQCLEANRYTVSSLIYCITIEQLPVLELKYRG